LDKEKYEALLSGPLKCPKCGQDQPNIPKAKEHVTKCDA